MGLGTEPDWKLLDGEKGEEDALPAEVRGPVAPGEPPVRLSRRARAPKDIRRAKGVVGSIVGASPSSMTDSSDCPEENEPDLGEYPKGEVWVGETPERPIVLIDIRRRVCALAAAVAIEPGNGGVVMLLLLLVGAARPNRVEIV